MICQFTATPCRYIHCPLWVEEQQGCRFAMVLAKLLAADNGSFERVLGRLTPKERAVLHLMAQGHTNRQISQALSVEYSTVKNHVSNIIGKLGVSNRVQAVLAYLTEE